MKIRRLSADDWQLWREVRLRALEEAPAAFGSALADWSGNSDLEQRWRARLDNVPANFVAYLEGKAIGQVSGAYTEHDERVELISMWVAPEARGAGVGDALVGLVESWARSVGAEFLVLSVKIDNGRAIGLYERHGFARTAASADRGEFEMVKRLR